MSLRRDEGCIYLCFLLRPVGFCFSKILHLCHLGVTKSACPTAAEKCLSTAICPYSRWRSQPLSRVGRKQRYNTLDFPTENRVPTGMLAPLLETQRQRNIPFAIPHFPRRCIYKLQKRSLFAFPVAFISNSSILFTLSGYIDMCSDQSALPHGQKSVQHFSFPWRMAHP